jgi:hypothetical protein
MKNMLTYISIDVPKMPSRTTLVDEIVELGKLRGYLKAFVGAVYQNPKSIFPQHQGVSVRRAAVKHIYPSIEIYNTDI